MNAELYMLRNMNKSRLSNAEINNVAAALKEKSINIIYKTVNFNVFFEFLF